MRFPDDDMARGSELGSDVVSQFLHPLPCPDGKQLRVERPGVGLEDQFFH